MLTHHCKGTTSCYFYVLFLGISVIYLLVLSFFLFLNYKQIKSILEFIDPKLKDAGPDTKVTSPKP